MGAWALRSPCASMVSSSRGVGAGSGHMRRVTRTTRFPLTAIWTGTSRNTSPRRHRPCPQGRAMTGVGEFYRYDSPRPINLQRSGQDLTSGYPPAHRDKTAMNGAQHLIAHGDSSGLMNGPPAKIESAAPQVPAGGYTDRQHGQFVFIATKLSRASCALAHRLFARGPCANLLDGL